MLKTSSSATAETTRRLLNFESQTGKF